MMRRQEKFSSPDDVHDPHRLVVSRRVILRTRTPRCAAWRATAASRSRRASRTRKSWICRETKQASEFTQISGSKLDPKESSTVWIQTIPRCAGRCSILCGTPRSGSNAPGSSCSFSVNPRSLEPIQGACLAAKPFASTRFARAGIVKTTSCVAARNLNINWRAAAERLSLTR